MDREWNLVFSVLAVQLEKVDCEVLAREAAAWADDPSRDLPERLVAAGAMDEDDRRLVAALADLSVQIHGNSSTAALEAFGGEEHVRRLLQTEKLPAANGRAQGAATAIVCGKTLGDRLAGTSALQERMQYLPHLIHFAEIIGTLHARGGCHRNLHPGNLLITEFGEDVVHDWTCCKERGKADPKWDELQGALAALREKGANADIEIDPVYLAPEIIQGHAEKADARSDVYSIGAILYLLLAGVPPYQGGSVAEVLAKAVSDRPPLAMQIEPDAPAELVRVCERAMHKEPSARYATARHLVQELKQYTNRGGATLTATGVDAGADAKYKSFLGAAAAIMLILLPGFGYAYYSAAHSRDNAEKRYMLAARAQTEAESEKQKAMDQLDEMKVDATRLQAERDHADAARLQLENAMKDAQQAQQEAERKLARATLVHGEPTPKNAAAEQHEPPKAPENATPPAPEVAAPIPSEPAPTREEPASNPLPDIPLMANEQAPEKAPSTPAAAPEKNEKTAKPETVLRPTGLTRAEFAATLPEVAASLKMEKAANGDAVVVRAPGPKAQKIGFRDGDLITRINRNNVETTDQAGKVLANVKTEPGFSVRLIRDGQTGWMRVNFSDAAPTGKAPDANTPEKSAGPEKENQKEAEDPPPSSEPSAEQ